DRPGGRTEVGDGGGGSRQREVRRARGGPTRRRERDRSGARSRGDGRRDLPAGDDREVPRPDAGAVEPHVGGAGEARAVDRHGGPDRPGGRTEVGDGGGGGGHRDVRRAGGGPTRRRERDRSGARSRGDGRRDLPAGDDGEVPR